MKVKDLIKLLVEENQNAEVYVEFDACRFSVEEVESPSVWSSNNGQLVNLKGVGQKYYEINDTLNVIRDNTEIDDKIQELITNK